tara:strand:- start:1254 stop:1388 length:135 start_codon:yes stop_codon:yes gene_type:complete
MVIKIDPIEDNKNIGKKIGVFSIGNDAGIYLEQWEEYQHTMDRS